MEFTTKVGSRGLSRSFTITKNIRRKLSKRAGTKRIMTRRGLGEWSVQNVPPIPDCFATQFRTIAD